MTKKVYKQKTFSVITKNSNWEILTKNLLTFKIKDGVKDEKLWYFGHPLKNAHYGSVPHRAATYML